MFQDITELLEKNESSDKKTIILGYNNHFRNLSKKINIPTNNRLLVKTTKKDIRDTIEYNLEKYKSDIIHGIYPLNNIDFDYLLKTKNKINLNYKKNGYLTKTYDQMVKILDLLSYKNIKGDGIWISMSQNYNILSKIHPLKHDKIFAYTEPIHALLASFKWNNDELIKKYRGNSIKLIQKTDDCLNRLKKKRFLYYVSKESFIPHEKGNNIKYFSQVPVTILEKERVENVYKKFKKLGILKEK